MNKVIVNCETGEQETTQLAGNELKAYLDNEAKNDAEENAKAEADAQADIAKAVAQAKLAALGLTTDDLKALGLGGN